MKSQCLIPIPSSLESTTTATATTAPSTTRTTTTTTASAVGFLARLVLGLGRVVDQQRIEGQTIGQDVVADRGATDVDGVEGDGITAFGGHFDRAEGGVHLGGDGGDGAVEDGAYYGQIYGSRVLEALIFKR